jgi:hypothetical protein
MRLHCSLDVCFGKRGVAEHRKSWRWWRKLQLSRASRRLERICSSHKGRDGVNLQPNFPVSTTIPKIEFSRVGRNYPSLVLRATFTPHCRQYDSWSHTGFQSHMSIRNFDMTSRSSIVASASGDSNGIASDRQRAALAHTCSGDTVASQI